MSPYREAIIPFTHLRTVEFGGALQTVRPHGYGRWVCPACGHFGDSVRHYVDGSIGRVEALDADHGGC